MSDQRNRFSTTSDDVRVAYAMVGRGPPLVYATGWPVHIEVAEAGFLEDLAQGVTLIR
jgi:hypothetical protein